MQVWAVVEGFGIGSEFRKTRCAANNLRDHKLDSVKAISIHRAHQLLPELNRILFRSRLNDAVIRVYDEAGNAIKTHEHTGEFKEW